MMKFWWEDGDEDGDDLEGEILKTRGRVDDVCTNIKIYVVFKKESRY